MINEQPKHFELLKLAAKVLGYSIITIQHGKLCCTKDDKTTFHWNPATDDGDAFRLAVERDVFTNTYFNSRVATELFKCHDLHEATRLAILHLVVNGNKAQVTIFYKTNRNFQLNHKFYSQNIVFYNSEHMKIPKSKPAEVQISFTIVFNGKETQKSLKTCKKAVEGYLRLMKDNPYIKDVLVSTNNQGNNNAKLRSNPQL